MSAPTRRGPVGATRVLEVVWRSCAALALGWIAYGAWRLVLQPRPEGAIDLRLRWREVRAWFDGVPTYATFSDAVYPPASYLMLWPFAAWDSLAALRWFWLAVNLALLGWLAAQLVRAAGEGAWRRPFVAAALASYPIGATLGNGQLGLAVTACLLALVARLAAGPRDLRGDLALAGLFLVVLVKPSLGAYFFWTLLLGFSPLSLVH